MNIKSHCSIIGENGYNNHSRNFFSALNKFHNVKIRNFTVGKSWRGLNSKPHENEKYLTDEHKSMLFEQILWTNEKMGERKSYPIYSFDNSFVPDVNITLEPMNHYLFYDNHVGKINIGYNVWETTKYPDSFFKLIKKYDQFWVASEWHKNCLIEQGYDSLKVRVVPEGVDSSIFYPIDNFSFDKFRFFLVGRWEYRKSTEDIIRNFLQCFEGYNDVELLLSVDNSFLGLSGDKIKERLKSLNIFNDKIKIFNFPKFDEYLNLLKNCNVFISCARGEGWNLPLIEAMACGIPSLYSNWGAQLEFAKNLGLPVKIKGEFPAKDDFGNPIVGNYCEPDWEDFKKVLKYSYENFKEIKDKSLAESKFIRNTFTWENSAKIASHHISELVNIDEVSVDSFKKPKLLYICPHLSTGGMPQYTLKQIESFCKNYEIYLVEYKKISVSYTVQKNKIKSILGDKYFELGEDKSELIKIINNLAPDFIHFQEVPETFLDFSLSEKIFCDQRKYKILCTTHSSTVNPEHLVFLPDKYVLVSDWSYFQFKNKLGKSVDLSVWEFPIENLRCFTKSSAKKMLNLEKDYIHILNVGLFTPGKNQKEVIEVAKKLKDKKVKFHFIGNYAPNFEYYWKPLFEDISNNCVIWGERDDVDLFYQAADLFLFSSTYELNPIVIKEALSYNLPVISRKLNTYLNQYDNENVTYFKNFTELLSCLDSKINI